MAIRRPKCEIRGLLVCAFILLGSLFFGAKASAQGEIRCCLSLTDTTECRLEEAGDPCDIESRPAADCRPTRAGVVCGTPPDPATERSVNCSDYAACRSVILGQVDCARFRNLLECRQNSACFWFGGCLNRNDPGVCGRITDQAYCGTSQGSSICRWSSGRCVTRVEAEISSQYTRTGGLLPDCAYAGNCRSVNDLLQVLITVVREAFKYIGSIAFFFFVFGGITIVLSFGNPEKVTKGKEIITAAVVGIIVSFSAYVLVDFILEILQARAL